MSQVIIHTYDDDIVINWYKYIGQQLDYDTFTMAGAQGRDYIFLLGSGDEMQQLNNKFLLPFEFLENDLFI